MKTIANILNKYVIEFDWLCCAIVNSTVERDEFLERKNKLIKKTEKEILDEIEKIIPNTNIFDIDNIEYDTGWNDCVERIKVSLYKLRGKK